MPIEVLRPNAAGDLTELTPSAGANWECVDEAVADEDASYVHVWGYYYGAPGSGIDLYNLPAHAGSGAISSVTVYIRCRKIQPYTANGATEIKTGGSVYIGASNALTDSYVTYSTTYNLNPKTGVAWTWADIDALQIGVYLYAAGDAGDEISNQSRCTQVYVEVDYDPTALRIYLSDSFAISDSLAKTVGKNRSEIFAIADSILMGFAKGEVYAGIAFTSDPFDAVPVWDDVSKDVISYSFRRGRQFELDRFESGVLTLLLDNRSGHYWPDNLASPYSPNVTLRKRVRISVDYYGITYPRFVGYISKISPKWAAVGGLISQVEITCYDATSLIARHKLNNAGYAQEASGARIDNVLDAVGFPAADRVLDSGVFTMIASGALVNANPQEHIQKVCESEIGLFYIRNDGYAVFEQIDHRVNPPHDVALYTFAGDYRMFEVMMDDPLLYNEVRATRQGGAEQVASNAASQAAYGLNILSRSGLYLITDDYTLAYAYYLLGRYSFPTMRAKSLEIQPHREPNKYMPICLSLEISDRIKVQLSEGSIDKDYFIEGIDESFDYREGIWHWKASLSDVSQYFAPATPQSVILYPNSDVSVEHAPVGAVSNYECVNEVIADDLGTYIRNPADWSPWMRQDQYGLEDIGAAAKIITRVTIKVRWSSEGDGYSRANILLWTHGMWYISSVYNIQSYSWRDEYWVLLVNPFTGAKWTDAEINDLNIGVYSNNFWPPNPALSDHFRMTQMNVQVDYILI